jgi:hypothetical protein
VRQKHYLGPAATSRIGAATIAPSDTIFTLVRALSPTAVGNRYCLNDGRPHPHHTDRDTSFFRPSNQRYARMPTAFGLTALAVQALPAESFVGLGLILVQAPAVYGYRLIRPSIDRAPAPPKTSAIAIRKSASVYSMPLPLPGP